MHTPPNAIFSGYSMNYKYFQKLVLALSPDLVACLQQTGQQPYIVYVFQYDRWRRELPEDEQEKAPLLKVFHSPNRKNENEADADSKFFFWTRWVPAPEGSSMEDYPKMTQETDVDRSRRDVLIALIEQRANFSVDKAHLQFESVKHHHPLHDPLRGF